MALATWRCQMHFWSCPAHKERGLGCSCSRGILTALEAVKSLKRSRFPSRFLHLVWLCFYEPPAQLNNNVPPSAGSDAAQRGALQGSRALSQLSRWARQGLSFTNSWNLERKVKMQTHAWKLRKAPVPPGIDCQIQPPEDWMAFNYCGLMSPSSYIWC